MLIVSTRPFARTALPPAHAAGIDVNELRLGIVADAADCEREGLVAQPIQPRADEPHVHRLALHVETALGNSVAARAEHLVRLRGAVGGDDLERAPAARAAPQLVENVEQLRMHPIDVAGAE